MAANMMNSDENWRTPMFRQNMVTKIDEAILNCGAPTNKNAIEMEGQVFSKAKTKEEYLGFVARLIIHIKEMGPKPKLPGGPGMTNQQSQVAGQVGSQMGGQQNMNMMGTMGMNVMNQPGMVQMQQGMVQQGVPQNSNMMGIPPQQQQAQQQMQQQQIQQQQIQQQQMQQQQQQQIQHQQQIQQQQQQLQQQQMQHQQQQQQQQNPQQSQMMNQSFLNQQNQQMQQNVQLQNQQIQNQNPQMQNPQVQQMQQIQTSQIQGLLPSQQQQQMMQNRGGMVNPSQMTPNRMIGPQQTMASQLSQMAQQQQRKVHRPLGPNAMGIPRPEHGPSYSMNRFQYYPSNISQQVENVNMMGQYQGPSQQQQRVNQFIPPSSSQGMSAAPSPTSMPVPGQVGPSPSYGNSPGSNTIMHSPARPFSSQIHGVPSPNPSLNTPMPSIPATPSPRNAEDQACFEKIKELKKYTDLLQRMIAKIGNEDVEKSSKMKKLLEILTNPNQRVSMEILLKCEAALKKMERQQHDAGGLLGPAPPPTPSKDTTSPFQQIQDAVLATLKGGSSNHTLLRTFRHTIGTFGSPIDSTAEDVDSGSESETNNDIPWTLLKELQFLDKRCNFKLKRSSGTVVSLILFVTLSDTRLPKVPPLKIIVSGKYPIERPTILNFYKEYVSTPFFRDVAKALKYRLGCVDTKPTVTEIIDCWEMSVRQTVAPLHKRYYKSKVNKS